MFNLPHTRNEWIIALASAITGFFVGGAAIAAAQALLRKLFGLTG